MKFCELEKEVLYRISKDWIDSRKLYDILVESGHLASYYDVRVSLDGLQLRGIVEVKRSGLPWPDIIGVRRVQC